MNYKRFLLIVSVLFFISCEEEFLERSPTNAISDTEALKSVENMQLVLNGVHRGLFSQSGTVLPGATNNRANNQYWQPMGDNLAGYLIHSANANNLNWRENARWNDHILPTSLTNRTLWYHMYNIILHANLLINGIEESNFLETNELNQVLGQAYTYRAYAYLSLIQHFAKGYLIGNPGSDLGVPIVFRTEPPFQSAPRSTVQEVYEQIGLDLDAALIAFENGTGRLTGGGVAKSQLNGNIAHGLRARWALSKGDWDIAAQSAAIAREGFPLLNEEEWLSGFNTVDLSEVIWGSRVIEMETTFFRAYFYLASNTFNGSQVRNNPKIADRRVIDAIPPTDYRKKAFLPDAPNSNTSAANGNGGWAQNKNPLYATQEEFNTAIDSIKSVYGLVARHNTHPYMHFKLRNSSPGTSGPDDVIYMRSSEMFLIEAEALTMAGDIPGAQNALNTLGSARDSEFDVSIFNTQESLMEQIKFQRRVELWGEGFGYTDKIRWDEGIDHGVDGGSGATEVIYQKAFKIEKPSLNNDWIFKIPQAEIDANPNISPSDQN